MRRKELVEKVADKTGQHKADIDLTVTVAMQEIISALSEGKSVYLRGFGTFTPKIRKSKKAQIMKKKEGISETIILPETAVPYFKPCKDFKREVAQNVKP